MSEPHAAIALTQLRRLDEFIAHRTSIAAGYDAALPELGLTPVAIPTGAVTNYYKYIAYLPDGIDRAVLKKRLREEFDVAPLRRGLRGAVAPAACLRAVGGGTIAGRRGAVRPPRLPAGVGGDDHRATRTTCSTALREVLPMTRSRIVGHRRVGLHRLAASSTPSSTPATTVRVLDPHPPHRDDVDWREVDVLDLDNLTKALDGSGPVFHLAAMADVNDVIAGPARATEVNVVGTVNVLEAARQADAGRVILASTVWVYDATRGERVDETACFDPDTNRHLYVSTKIAAELACRDYLNLYQRPFTVLRYGIPYGPRMRPTTVLAVVLPPGPAPARRCASTATAARSATSCTSRTSPRRSSRRCGRRPRTRTINLERARAGVDPPPRRADPASWCRRRSRSSSDRRGPATSPRAS